MKIRIKRFDKSIPLPKHQTDGAAAFDLAAREAVTIPARGVGYVPLNVAIEAPKGCFILLAARSSTHKKGLIPANGIGIIDADYCGDEDEIKAALLNFTDTPVTVEKGDRVMQAIFMQYERADWEEVDAMPNKTRGGFGSTGSK